MFREVTQNLKKVEYLFKENIRDSFGMSVANEIFLPLFVELVFLEQLEEEVHLKLIEIDTLLVEAQSMV
jgi:hypothetical protein